MSIYKHSIITTQTHSPYPQGGLLLHQGTNPRQNILREVTEEPKESLYKNNLQMTQTFMLTKKPSNNQGNNGTEQGALPDSTTSRCYLSRKGAYMQASQALYPSDIPTRC